MTFRSGERVTLRVDLYAGKEIIAHQHARGIVQRSTDTLAMVSLEPRGRVWPVPVRLLQADSWQSQPPEV